MNLIIPNLYLGNC